MCFFYPFGPPHPKPLFHARVARKEIGFRLKRGIASGVMDSCPPASAVRALKGLLGVPARPWCDFHVLFHSALVVVVVVVVVILIMVVVVIVVVVIVVVVIVVVVIVVFVVVIVGVVKVNRESKK